MASVERSRITIPKNFIIDSDGVFTDGKFYYSVEGKVMKKYGPDDADALSLIKKRLNIHVVTGDKRGYPITYKRIKEDMKLSLDLVSTFQRMEWISMHYDPNETIYMGDGIYDPIVFKSVSYSIAPANASSYTKKYADFVTTSKGSEGAVFEAVIHILKKFFKTDFDVFSLNFQNGSGAWKKDTK